MHTIYLIVGRSGCGKTAIAEELVKKGYSQLPSFTTRNMRNGEIDGVGHKFIKEFDFHVMKSNDEIAASTYFNGHFYGATKEQILNNDIYVIDKSGLVELRQTMYNEVNVVAIYIDSNIIQTLWQMHKRGDSWKSIISRWVNDNKMFFGARELCDYKVKNKRGELDKTIFRIEEIIRVEMLYKLFSVKDVN